MSDYTKLTNFAVKDSYTTGTPAKVIKGTELDDEFNAIAAAVATKVNSASPTITGTATIDTASITNNASIGGNATVTGTLSVTGASTLNGNTTLNGSLIFEGATANGFETTVSVTDPTADRTITFPDKTGTVALTSDIVNSSLTSQNGTYSIAGTTTLTVTATAHGRAVNDVVYLNFTSGTAVDGSYTITSVATNTFVVTHGTSITSSGNVSVHYSNKGFVEFISADEAAVGTSTSKAMTAAASSALIASTSIGGSTQSWQNVFSSRANGTTYTNSTGRPITVLISGQCVYATAYVDSVKIVDVANPPDFFPFSMTFIVPNGSTYSANLTYLQSWAELR